MAASSSSSSSIKPIFTTRSKSSNSSKSSLLSFLHNTNPKPISLKFSSHNSNYTTPPSFTIRNSLQTALETSELPVSKFQDDLNLQAVTPKPTILVSEKLGEAGLAILRSFGNVECLYDLSPEALCEKISQCDALIVRSGTKVTRSVFEAANGKLKVVGRAGVGIDNVDLQAATEFGCLVVNAPIANTVAAAEHGIALLASMARNVSQADASIKAGKWLRSKYVGVSLVGKTLAVMGFGKVGSEVARRAKGLGMNVIAHDPYAPADKARAVGVELVSFDQALATADFISLHMPLNPTTSKIFNDETFAKMKKGVRIVNVARGGVIDEEALVRALDSGVVAQAALDVFTEEPPAKDSKLVQHENVTVTPHLGASTKEAQEGVAIEIAEAVVGALRGELSATAINAPMVPSEVLSELAPYVVLAKKLGRLAVQLVSGGSGIKSVKLIYRSARDPDDLDTRILRAMITKGIIEPISASFINLVNADFTAKQKGLRISEERVVADSSPEFPKNKMHLKNDDVEVEEDDDRPMLSSQALAALQEFLSEQNQTSETAQNKTESDSDEVALVSEDWRLSQFWYDAVTAETVAQEAVSLCSDSDSRVACIACPTLYAYLKKIRPEVSAKILEYDMRFEQYGSDFAFYDYNQPQDLPLELKHAFNVVVADPPYLSKECLEKVSETVSFLARPGDSKLLLLTGEVQKERAAELLGLRPCGFRPQHSSKLGNEFRLFTNYGPGTRLGGWEQEN